MDTQNNSAKFAFFYMLSLVALVFMALAGGMIIFQIINKKIVDVLSQYSVSFSPDQLKFAISAIIIAAPIYYLTMRQIFKNLYSGALSKDSGIRKWLTYFILFVASVVMLGWLIAVINNFLDGELTIKFILKAMTAIVIAAAVFTFYFYDIKREETAGKKDKVMRIYFYGSLAAVSAIFIASLFFVESPAETRNRKLDNAILDNFQKVDGALNTYYQDYEKLPADLEELKTEFTYITDKDLENPATKEKFEYKIINENTYELCAAFIISNKDEDVIYGNYDYKDRWPHEAGYQCLGQKVRDKNSCFF
jgi:hypothetical protein